MRIVGYIQRVNGPIITIKGVKDLQMLELVYVSDDRLIAEVVKLKGDTAVIQVYEETTGLYPGMAVYGSGMSLSVELGPGLMSTIYDGIQRPLENIKDEMGSFIKRGVVATSLDRYKKYSFTPLVNEDQVLKAGEVFAVVKEGSIDHYLMIPFSIKEAKVISIAKAADYKIEDKVIKLKKGNEEVELNMIQRWPIRKPRPTMQRLTPSEPLITGQRVIDILFPLAKGGTVAIPGGFGTGKTMTQHAIAQWCDADIIIYIGCGERGNEMTDVLREFPHLIDPRTNESIMKRTILIANTSNMPVSAREASIYTGITIAEYYRDMGYHVAIMADSTSRWAEALRELGGRMEEMPAEEGFPAYLPTRIAEFYERAGYMKSLNGKTGSISVIGAVSPPGGDFSEPVTQHTKRFVRCFWGLDRALASARHYPAISWLDSYTEYVNDLETWWSNNSDGKYIELRSKIMDLLQKEIRLQQIVKLVGSDALPDSQQFILEVCNLFKTAFLQQNAFDENDKYSDVYKQIKMLEIIMDYYDLGVDSLNHGVTILKLKRLSVVQKISRMRFEIKNGDKESLQEIHKQLIRSISQIGEIYAK